MALWTTGEVALCIVFAVALAGAVAGLIWLLHAWLQARALAIPNHRSSHVAPTPQGGGLAVIPVALVGALIAWTAGAYAPGSDGIHLIAIAAGAICLLVVGFLDDMHSLPVTSRLGVQVFAAVLMVATLPDFRLLPPWWPPLAERILVLVGVLWFINAVNFMDGMDWLTGSETIAITLGVLVLAVLGLIPAHLGWLGAILLGAMVGFMPWNAPPARLFLGDAGSLPLGLLLAALLVLLALHGAVVAAIILPLYYTADATLTLLRRAARGDRVWEAHREHFYQLGLRRGLRVRRVVGMVSLLNAALMLLAVAATAIGGAAVNAFALMAAALLTAATLRALAGRRRTA